MQVEPLRKLFAVDFSPRTNVYDRLFAYLLAASVVLRFLWLDRPVGSLIFDETYYVNVARIILGLPHDPKVYPGAPSGIDPNHEHPPLAKMLIVLSMAIFGDNAYGWRIPSVAFGAFSIFIFYLLMKKISRKPAVALISSFLFSFDNLVFVHSRIATLDIFVLAFMLLGFYWYFTGRPMLSALALALSTLSKIGGLYGFAALALYHIANEIRKGQLRNRWPQLLGWFERYFAVYGFSFLAILTVLDRLWGGYQNPLDHLGFIYGYTFQLRTPAVRSLTDIWSYPWEWLLNEVKIHYLTVNVNVIVDSVVKSTYASIDFIGAMNPLVLYLAIPSMAYAVYDFYETRNQFTLFLLAWFTATYLPFYPMSILGQRIMYIFYFLNTLPAVAAAAAYMVVDQKPPKIVVGIYLAAVVVGFWMLFPFKVIP